MITTIVIGYVFGLICKLSHQSGRLMHALIGAGGIAFLASLISYFGGWFFYMFASGIEYLAIAFALGLGAGALTPRMFRKRSGNM